MFRYYIITITLIFFSTLSILAQKIPSTVKLLWEKSYDGKVTDALVLNDNKIVLVGSYKYKTKGIQGFVQIIDTLGNTLASNYEDFGSKGDDYINGVAQDNAANLYLAGTVVHSNGKSDGWIIKIGTDLKNITKQYLDTIGNKNSRKSNITFKKIISLSDTSLLVAGHNDSQGAGNLTLFTFNNDLKLLNSIDRGKSMVEDVVFMERQLNDTIVLCGNQLGKKGIWWGKTIDGGINLQLKKDNEKNFFVSTATLDIKKNLIAAGSIEKEITLKSAIFKPEEKPKITEPKFEYSKDLPLDHKILAICQSYTNNQFWAIQSVPSWNENILICGKKGQEFIEGKFLTLPKTFVPIKIAYAYQGKYVIIGNSEKETKIYCFADPYWQSGGKDIWLKVSASAELVDKDGDGELSAIDEGAYIKVTISNEGDVASMGGKVFLKSSPNLGNGVSISTQSKSYSPLLPNTSVSVSFPLAFDKNRLTDGNYSVSFGFKNDNGVEEPMECVARFQTKKKEQFLVKEQNLTRVIIEDKGDKSTKTTSKSTEVVRARIIYSKEVKKEHINVERELKGGKDPKVLMFEYESEGLYSYIFQTEVKLDSGKVNRVIVRFEGKSDTCYFDYTVKPNLYVLAIGPKYPKGDLKYTATDANAFVECIKKQERVYFNDVRIVKLLTDNAFKADIDDAFIQLSNLFETGKIRTNDCVMVYYSGHGKMNGNKFYLAPLGYDKGPGYYNDYKYIIDEYMSRIKCDKIFFLDACHSGGASKDANTDMADINRMIEEANRSVKGAVTYTSCQGNQKSWEIDELKRGSFTQALIEAMENEKNNPYGNDIFLSYKELDDYLKKRVSEINEQYDKATQEPNFFSEKTENGLKLPIFAKLR
jgi:hypothetical protein